ncbi:hypothetical protein BJ138DRAFT_1014981 [Hygrophoropsis aurantiaca]|uniref:Uncharacterized protein n=1 Tax=Hygrophoropsis aurantiaca TaxID=72124 RepID=A0ACB8A1Y1_9AGAM|nr:hypothetical protein BJ138DRAFT_1014981 [Hygrophoropsis aurantiaca]
MSTSKQFILGSLLPPNRSVADAVAGAHIFTVVDLWNYNGTDPEKPTYMAIKGQVFDVSDSKDFHQDGPMGGLAGKDCSRILAQLRTGDPDNRLGGIATTRLTESESQFLEQWSDIFR